MTEKASTKRKANAQNAKWIATSLNKKMDNAIDRVAAEIASRVPEFSRDNVVNNSEVIGSLIRQSIRRDETLAYIQFLEAKVAQLEGRIKLLKLKHRK